MARERLSSQIEQSEDVALCRRVARFRRKGDERRALVLLREAAHTNEHAPAIWVRYGLQCARSGRQDEAERAMSHAAWLRERSREPAKARVTRGLLGRPFATRAA